MSKLRKAIKQMMKDSRGRVTLTLVSVVLVSVLVVFISYQIKNVVAEKQLIKAAEQTAKYEDTIKRYNDIKKEVENTYYSEEEKAVISSKASEIEGLMSEDNLSELVDKVSSLEEYIVERNSTEMANARGTYNNILDMDISWLTDKEREVIEIAKNEFTSAFNSGDSSKISSELDEIKKLQDEYKDLIQRRKYDSSSITVTEPSYINGIMIVNKHFALPKTYNYGEDKTAKEALNKMTKDAAKEGIKIRLVSGYRSYTEQVNIFARNVAQEGEYEANQYSAKAGFSEHQSGLTFDLGGTIRSTDLLESFGDTKEGKWLAENAHKYGFIIRFLKGKEEITGYQYEPWHVRYIGVEDATAMKGTGQCLEEYLGLYPFE